MSCVYNIYRKINEISSSLIVRLSSLLGLSMKVVLLFEAFSVKWRYRFWCVFREDFLPKPRPHCSHLNFLSFKCISLKWHFKCPFSVKLFEECSHLNGLILLCFFSWVFIFPFELNFFKQILHWCVFWLWVFKWIVLNSKDIHKVANANDNIEYDLLVNFL